MKLTTEQTQYLYALEYEDSINPRLLFYYRVSRDDIDSKNECEKLITTFDYQWWDRFFGYNRYPRKYDHYVYIGFVDGKPKYVGKGKDDRYKHLISSHSSCALANEHIAIGGNIDVVKVADNLSNKVATEFESYMIQQIGLPNLWNKKK